MNETGLYSATVAAGSSISSIGKNAELRKRITNTSGKRPWTTDALPERSAIAAPIPPKAIAARVTNRIISRTPITPSSIVRAEDQPDRQVPDRREHAQRRRAREPPEHDREARDRRRKQAVGEAHLDVDRQRDPAAVAREQARLDHRPGEHEVEEAVHLGEAGQVHGRPGAPGLHRQEQRAGR